MNESVNVCEMEVLVSQECFACGELYPHYLYSAQQVVLAEWSIFLWMYLK